MSVFDLTAERERLDLAPDCARCFGLCCVAHAFRASTSFAFDKPAGEPCPNLQADFGCAVHRTLRQQGFSGCTAYTCYGAGQTDVPHFSRLIWPPTLVGSVPAVGRVGDAEQVEDLPL